MMVAARKDSMDESDDRFMERPNPDACVFDHLPSKETRKEFLNWVKKTGMPDRWRYHVNTRPPKDVVPRILERFDIPDKLRPSVGLAPCPICSIRGGIYFAGMLAWFEKEKCLRAIGNECGMRHFNEEDYNAELDRFGKEQSDEAITDFLFANYSKIAQARAFIGEAKHAARAVDDLRRKFRKAIGKGEAKKIYRLAEGERLPLFEESRVQVFQDGVPVFDVEGEPVTRIQQTTVDNRHVEGMGVLRDVSYVAEVHMARADIILGNFSFMADDEKTINQLVEWGTEGRSDAESKMRTAWKEIEIAMEAIAETLRFFERKNLERFIDWGMDRRCPFHFFGHVENNGDVRIGQSSKGAVRIETAIPKIELKLPSLS
jgi:hypothetical protein